MRWGSSSSTFLGLDLSCTAKNFSKKTGKKPARNPRNRHQNPPKKRKKRKGAGPKENVKITEREREREWMAQAENKERSIRLCGQSGWHY